MFTWEWDKENVQAHFSDKDLSQIWNALSQDISKSKSKHRQDIPDLHHTKNHSLLNLLFSIQTGHNLPDVHDLKNNSAA